MQSKRLFFLFLCLAGLWGSLVIGCSSPPAEEPPTGLSNADLQNLYAQKAERYLVKDDTLNNWFAVLPDGVAMYASPEDKLNNQPECLLYYDEIEAFGQMVYGLTAEEALTHYENKGDKRWSATSTADLPPLPEVFTPGSDPAQPLAGLRVMLDPGHMGGEMEDALMEEKAVRMHPNDSAGIPQELSFNEGNLVLATARLLKSRLEDAGATVALTRDMPGVSAFGLSYAEWKKTKYDSALAVWIEERELTEEDQEWFEKADDKQIFHAMFKHLDLRERARKMNAFRPHINVIIHYNVGNYKIDPDKYVAPTDENYNMAFVPGGYMAGELRSPDRRMEFLAQIVTQDIENSIELSDQVVQAFVEKTGVPALDEPHGLFYLEKASLATPATGVWARNLAINRMTRGTLVFGETLFQNYVGEALVLDEKDLDVDGLQVSSRVIDVADAYYKGICDYYGVPVGE